MMTIPILKIEGNDFHGILPNEEEYRMMRSLSITPTPVSPAMSPAALLTPDYLSDISSIFSESDDTMQKVKGIRLERNGKTIFQCPFEGCTQTFTRESGNLQSHYAIIHQEKRPFTCLLCDRDFGRRSDLRRHVRTVHTENEPIRCHLCSKTFKRKDGLKRHQSRDHGLDSPIPMDSNLLPAPATLFTPSSSHC